MKNTAKISVVIPTFNSWQTLNDCLISIKSQSLQPQEVIVIDNASSDGTVEKVSKYFPWVRLVAMRENTGVTGGRNAGIKAAKGYEYLFFFDHDMVAEKEMLSELTKTIRSDAQIGIVTPKICYWEDKKRIWAAGTGINLWSGQVLFRGGKDTGQFEMDEEVQVAPAALLVKKVVINKIKEFEERYFATYEDTDFCFRAKTYGYKTFYAHKAIAWHKISTDPAGEADRLLSRAYFVGRNRILFMKDFGNNFYVFLLFIPVYCIYYLVLAIKNQRVRDWTRLLKGVFDGLKGT